MSKALEKAGFTVVGTGGGFKAYYFEDETGHVLIATPEGSAPEVDASAASAAFFAFSAEEEGMYGGRIPDQDFDTAFGVIVRAVKKWSAEGDTAENFVQYVSVEDRVGYAPSTAVQWMKWLGFKDEHTGGNCRAWVREQDGWEVMITEGDWPTAPRAYNADALIAIREVGADYDEEAVFTRLRKAIEALRQLETDEEPLSSLPSYLPESE
jgi:hypothetical protein